MKKSIILALGLMLGAFSMVGCSKDAANEQINGNIKEFTLISHADAPDTRMVINGDKATGFATAWENGDQIGVYAINNDIDTQGNTYNKAHTGTVDNSGHATFSGNIRYNDTTTTTYNLFAYYPYTAGSNHEDEDGHAGVDCLIATTQTMNGNSFDKSCAYMVAKTGLTAQSSKGDQAQEIGNWQFRHTVAFINLSTKSISAEGVSGDEIVKSVKLEAVGIKNNPTLAGEFAFNLENGEMTFDVSKATNVVTVNVPTGTTLSNLSAWFVTNPFEMTADDELEIIIYTKAHIIKKNVSVVKKFEAANVYTLNIAIDNKCAVTDAEPVVVVPNGTVLWSEDFSKYQKDAVPSSSKAYNNEDDITYKFSNSSSKVFDDNLAKGASAPELLLAKSSTWTISNILTGNCEVATLTFRANQNSDTYWGVSSQSAGVTIGKPTIDGDDTNEYSITYIIQFNNVSTFDLVLTNSSSSKNTRIDDIKLVAGTVIGNPTNISATLTPTELKASWTAVPNASGYEWYLTAKDSGDILLGKTTTEGTNITATGTFTEGTEYVLYVKSVAGGDYDAPEGYAEKAITCTAVASTTKTYTLTFPDGNSKGVQNYTTTWKATVDDRTWSIENFNNNNNGWKYIRCGSKSAISTASVATTWAVKEAIQKVVVTVDKYTTGKSGGTVNSTKLIVASDASFNNVVYEVSLDMTTDKMTYNITKPAANCYYKLVYDCAKGGGNGFVQISEIVYTNAE